MPRRRLLWQLYITILLITSLSLLAVAAFGTRQLRNVYYERTSTNLVSVAGMVRQRLGDSIPGSHPADLDSLCKALGDASGVRITLILPTGRVVGDSHEDSRQMGNHATRPEISSAYSGQTGTSTRYSRTLGTDMMYAAIPVLQDGNVVAVVRTALPMARLQSVLNATYASIGLGWLVIVACVAFVSLYASRRISKPIEDIRGAAERLAGGDLRVRAPVHANTETVDLAMAINRAAALLEERINSLVQQRNEQQAVLSSMVEGVIAVDMSERVININRAAAKLIDINPLEAQGRIIQEVVRNSDLQQFVTKTLASSEPAEGDIVFQRAEQRFLQAHGTLLRNAQGHSIGALVVLNDVTRLRRLERVRSEFVANVSHELKTPITSIKGFVETLQDGAVDNPEDTRRFLDIISRHTDRLHNIVEDLLALSRIEQDAEKGDIPVEERRVTAMIRSAIQLCQPRADEKSINLMVRCSDSIRVNANAALLEQALVNLVDNAIKYSEDGSSVEVSADEGPDEVLISVRDEGPGIEERHFERIFERFYRIDRARSRELGGTGLGLAIVKHIAQAHGGAVTIDSMPGKGSTFTIHLPSV